jgi:small multidrug resistance family-3 protein
MMTPVMLIWSAVLFGIAGLAEIGGGWLVWKVIRDGAAWYWAVTGGVVLVGYGFIPTLQPFNSFGRLYAAYGGAFVFLSILWAWQIDKQVPDSWDWLGGVLCLVGAAIIIYAPRSA